MDQNIPVDISVTKWIGELRPHRDHANRVRVVILVTCSSDAR